MVLAFGKDLPLMGDVVDVLGFWGLTFLCMTPMVAFIMYVWKGPIAMGASLVVLSGLLLVSFLFKKEPSVPLTEVWGAVAALVLPGLIGGLVAALGVLTWLQQLQKQLHKKA